MKRLICLLILSLTLLCVSCGEKLPKMVDFVPDSGYTILRSDTSVGEITSSTVELSKAIAAAGLELQIDTDWVKRGEQPPESGKEILVGMTNRTESENALSELKCEDFTILRDGDRIIIAGITPAATVRAVDFFIENCIGEGKLMLPESPYISHASYKVDTLKLDGAAISEYVIYHEKTSNDFVPFAEQLQSAIAAVSGDLLEIVNEKPSGKAISLVRAEGDSAEIEVADSEIKVIGGGKYGMTVAVNELLSLLTPEDGQKSLDVKLENRSFDAKVEPMISLNLPTEYPAMDIEASTDGIFAGFEQARAELPEEITVLEPIKPEKYPYSLNRTFFVSPDGDDTAQGTIDSPLRTPAAALAKLEGAVGGVIYLREGSYKLDKTLEINGRHSGSDISPLFIAAYNGENVKFTGGIDIPIDSFVKVSDAKSFKKSALENIYEVDLSELGIESKDIPPYSSSQRAILLIDNDKGELARYPNVGEELLGMGEVLKIGRVTNPPATAYGLDNTDGWEFLLPDKRAFEWSDEDEVWFYGSTSAEFQKKHFPVSFDREKGSVKSPESNTDYGAVYNKNNKFYFYNIPEELDTDGEWYLDRNDCKLYIYATKLPSEVSLVLETDTLVNISGVDNVVIDGISFTGTMGSGITATASNQLMIENCEFTNLGKHGAYIINSYSSGVIYSNFSKNGTNQCWLAGGDRKNLRPSHNFIQNCRFSEQANCNGTWTEGVGYVMSHNYFDTTVSFVYASNEAVIEYNEYVGGSSTTIDGGFIYVNGHFLSGRGNHIRYNYMHDPIKSYVGVFVDDLASGHYVYCNIVDVDLEISQSRVAAYLLHNGRENVFYNNVAINAENSAFNDCLSYYYPDSKTWSVIRERIMTDGKDMVNSERFAARYPTYIRYYEKQLQNLEDIKAENYTRNENEEDIRTPQFCTYRNNLIINCPKPYAISKVGQKTAGGMDTNYITEKSPLDENYQLTDAAAKSALSEWEQLPFERMGLSK